MSTPIKKIKMTIFVDKEKSKELKKRAIDAEMTVSAYLADCSDKAVEAAVRKGNVTNLGDT